VSSEQKSREDTDDEDELEAIDKGPLDCIAVLFVPVFCGAALDQGVADEGVEGRGGGGGDEGSVWGERARPQDNAPCSLSATTSREKRNLPLCEMEQWSSM